MAASNSQNCSLLPSCRIIVVAGTRSYNPNIIENTPVSVAPPLPLEIPNELNVTQDLAGTPDKQSTLTFTMPFTDPATGNSEQVVCTYNGGSPVANPITPAQVEAAKHYIFDSCNPSNYTVGSLVTTSQVSLTVINGGNMNDGEVITAQAALNEVSNTCSSGGNSTCSPLATSTPSSQEISGSKIPLVTIIVTVAAIVVFLLLVIILVCMIKSRKKRRKLYLPTATYPPPNFNYPIPEEEADQLHNMISDDIVKGSKPYSIKSAHEKQPPLIMKAVAKPEPSLRGSFRTRSECSSQDSNFHAPADITVVNPKGLPPLPEFLQLDFIEDVQLGSVLQEGGSGTVFESELLNNRLIKKHGHNRIAVKIFKDMDCWTPEENSSNFLQEVAILWSLSFQPNVLKMIGYTPEPKCIIMKLYSGTLQDMFINNLERPFPQSLIVNFGLSIVSAMTEIHALGVIHRDLKSANIFIHHSAELDTYELAIGDFGLSRLTSDTSVQINKKSTAVGLSYHYASPETYARLNLSTFQQVDNEEDKRSDVYSFGIILWEMLERKSPWEGLQKEDIKNSVLNGNRPEFSPQLSSNQEYITSTLVQITKECWSQNPYKRPAFYKLREKFRVLRNHFQTSESSITG